MRLHVVLFSFTRLKVRNINTIRNIKKALTISLRLKRRFGEIKRRKDFVNRRFVKFFRRFGFLERNSVKGNENKRIPKDGNNSVRLTGGLLQA